MPGYQYILQCMLRCDIWTRGQRRRGVAFFFALGRQKEQENPIVRRCDSSIFSKKCSLQADAWAYQTGIGSITLARVAVKV